MIDWIVTILLTLAGLITGMFLLTDNIYFEIIQMVIAVLLITLIVIFIAFWPTIKKWFLRNRK